MVTLKNFIIFKNEHIQQDKEFISVETCKKMWQNLQDPFRKMEMQRIVCGGSGGQKKSGTEGQTLAERLWTGLIMIKWASWSPTSMLNSNLFLLVYINIYDFLSNPLNIDKCFDLYQVDNICTVNFNMK